MNFLLLLLVISPLLLILILLFIPNFFTFLFVKKNVILDILAKNFKYFFAKNKNVKYFIFSNGLVVGLTRPVVVPAGGHSASNLGAAATLRVNREFTDRQNLPNSNEISRNRLQAEINEIHFKARIDVENVSRKAREEALEKKYSGAIDLKAYFKKDIGKKNKLSLEIEEKCAKVNTRLDAIEKNVEEALETASARSLESLVARDVADDSKELSRIAVEVSQDSKKVVEGLQVKVDNSGFWGDLAGVCGRFIAILIWIFIIIIIIYLLVFTIC
jgi:hypothetical protein